MSSASKVSLRPVRLDDREMVYRWRNDPFIVAHGSSNRTVSWTEHAQWFDETLAKRDRKMYIIVQRNVAIGQIRFDRQNELDCVVSVYLLQEFTGHGLGVLAIREGCRLALEGWDVKRVIACVRGDNPNGRSAFLKAGFQEQETGLCPPEHYSLTLHRGTVKNA